MKFLLIAFSVAALGFGQVGRETTLSGHLTDSITHQAVAGAEVTYSPGGYSTTSDSAGAYAFHFPATAEVRGIISISKPGYATPGISTEKLFEPLKRGASETRDFELSRSARIRGHLIDRDSGKPVAGFRVELTPFTLTNATSAADGSFELANLNPCECALEVVPPRSIRISFGEAKAEATGYAASWYPGVPRADMAAPIRLAAGEDREIEMRLQKRELRRIIGTIHVPEGMEGDAISVEVAGTYARTTAEHSGVGTFHIDGLQEGPYTILAWTKTDTGHGRAFVSRKLDVADRDIEDLDLTMRPGVALRALITMQEEKADVPARIDFMTFSLDGWAPDMGTQPSADRLRMAGLPPGKYFLLLNIPRGYAVASALFNGAPVQPNTPIDVENAESTITYVLTSKLASVAGKLLDADQKPIPDVNVWLLPDPPPDTLDRFFLLQRGTGGQVISDVNGRFHFAGLAPGHYVAAVSAGKDQQWPDPNALRSALPVVLEAGQAANVDLRAAK